MISKNYTPKRIAKVLYQLQRTIDSKDKRIVKHRFNYKPIPPTLLARTIILENRRAELLEELLVSLIGDKCKTHKAVNIWIRL